MTWWLPAAKSSFSVWYMVFNHNFMSFTHNWQPPWLISTLMPMQRQGNRSGRHVLKPKAKRQKEGAELQFLWARYETLPFSSRHSTAPQMQLSFPLCLFLLSPPILRPYAHFLFWATPGFYPPSPTAPTLRPSISMRAYLLFTAPRGYLSFSPLHCECHGDTRIPQSAGPDPPAAPP